MTEDTIAPFPFAQVICKYITAEDLDSMATSISNYLC